MEYILLIVSAIFVNNVVLSQFLGICPFMGVSNKVSTAMGMGAAVTFVMTLSSIVTFLIYKYVLAPLDIVIILLPVFVFKNIDNFLKDVGH